MQPRARTLDVARAAAPAAFGPRSLMWWGTLGIMLIEGTAFALAIGAYFYLRDAHRRRGRRTASPPPACAGARSTRSILLASLRAEPARASGPPSSVDLARRADLAGRLPGVRASPSTSCACSSSRT